jgi:hypothetical protein
MRQPHIVRLLVLASLTVLPASARAQRPEITIPRAAAPPVLARLLDGKTVPPGAKVAGFFQREPGDGVPSSLETTAYLSYDREHLYVVFVCHDNPSKIRANLSRRESIMSDDVVGLVLDTYHDGHRSYLFLANPLGIQMDGVTTEGQNDDYSYDALWHSDGRVTDDGYVVLMKIPFKSLRFSTSSVQTWGFALGRIVPRANETSFWPYITRRIAGFGQQMATLRGLEHISPGRNLQAIPYGNFAAARVLDEGARRTDRSARVGVDGKAVVKEALTVDLTVNPDFSQVESDEPQVTVNQRFEVFFPEKRPFFIENAGFFETPQTLFFSRRIADPGVGLRVTGRGRGWTFAGLAVDDEQPGRGVAEGDPRRDKLAGIGVFRLQREFARQSHVGALFTDREWGPAANRVFGADARWRIGDNWAVRGQWAGSHTLDGEGAHKDGTAWYASVNRSSRAFDYFGSVTSRSPGFRTDLGYIKRVDMRQVQQEAGYSWHPTKSRVLRFGPALEASVLWDHSSQLQDWSIEPSFGVEFAGQTELGFSHQQAFERYQGIEFRRHQTSLHASTEWLSWLSISSHYSRGTGINYYPSAGLVPFLGRERSVEASLTLRPLSRLRVDQSYIYSDLTAWGDAPPQFGTPGGRIFRDHILRTRANVQFTRALSGRVILDYESVTPNTGLIDLEREKRFNTDVLFTYLVNPWTAVYVGFSDGYANQPLGPMTERPVSRADLPLTSVGRQVFIKLSYLLRY